MLSFTNQVINGFNVSINAVRVAVVHFDVFDPAAGVDVQLGQYTIKTALQQAIVNVPYVFFPSVLFRGFITVRNVFQNASRPEAVRMLVLITNQIPFDTYEQLSNATIGLNSEGIRLVSVGVFSNGSLTSSARQLLSNYYDMILVNNNIELVSVVKQTTIEACPLRGKKLKICSSGERIRKLCLYFDMRVLYIAS
jgi:hypothetical protein